MKIVVITGSAHEDGTSAYLAEQFMKGAKEAGHESVRVDAAKLNVHPCVGCGNCQMGEKKCQFEDDMTEIAAKLIAADVVCLASPIYYYGLTAQLKAVIDRFFAHNSKLSGNKKLYALLTMAADTSSSEGTVLCLKNMADYLKWELAGVIEATGSPMKTFLG